MNTLPSKIHDHNNDLDYMLVGNYYLPELKPFEAPATRQMWSDAAVLSEEASSLHLYSVVA